MIQAGDYDIYATILQRSPARDAWGQQDKDAPWSELCRCWANIRQVSGVEAIKANAPASIVRASIRLLTGRGDIVPGMRVQDGATLYEIDVAMRSKERTDLVCTVVR